MLNNNRILSKDKNLLLIEKLFIQGLIITAMLVVIQFSLDNAKSTFMAYMPPLGFVFLEIITYGIQPLIIGVLNIVIIQVMYKLKGWQVGFWLNGIFLLLLFTAVNVVLETVLFLSFSPYVAIIDIALFSFPFGCLARFSNGGWNKPIN